MGRFFVFAGILFVVLGIIMMIVPHLPFAGRLPGDIHIKGKSFDIYFPLTTCLLLSALLTMLLHLIVKR